MCIRDRANVIAKSGRAVEAAGDVDVLLLDKTGTITHGNRQASAFLPAPGVTQEYLARIALLASLADETPEGRSILDLAKRLRVDDRGIDGARFIPFSAQDRMSGADLPPADGPVRVLRKGAADAIRVHVQQHGGSMPVDVLRTADEVARRGSTPLVVSEDGKALGVIELKDIVKAGINAGTLVVTCEHIIMPGADVRQLLQLSYQLVLTAVQMWHQLMLGEDVFGDGGMGAPGQPTGSPDGTA